LTPPLGDYSFSVTSGLVYPVIVLTISSILPIFANLAIIPFDFSPPNSHSLMLSGTLTVSVYSIKVCSLSIASLLLTRYYY
jgi:hypothetical protein